MTQVLNETAIDDLPPLNEPILPDDYPVYQGFLYVANGKVTEFIDGEKMTVGRWKALTIPGVPVVTEVRRCDTPGRKARSEKKRDTLKIMNSSLYGAMRDSKAGSVKKTIPGTVPSCSFVASMLVNSKAPKQKYRKPRSSNKIKKVMQT